LRSNVLRRDVATTLTRPSPFQQIMGEKTHLLFNILWTNALHRCDGRWRKVRTKTRFRSWLRRRRLPEYTSDTQQDRCEQGEFANQQAGHLEDCGD